MRAFLKYIVCFVLVFNAFENARSEVIFSFDNEETQKIETTPFINAGHLPHPIQLRQILDKEDNSAVGRLLMLGRYFDAKYPGEALNRDITDEVALIFPEYDKTEVYDMARKIQMSIGAYRIGKEKIDEIKQKMLTPEDPPLIVADDEYAIPGDREYLSLDENQYAVISDFKKVVGYSNNPREIKAMEEKLRRDAENARQKTDFEKFQQMWDKIEFLKIPSYGVTLPNPFVGNAGIGKWYKTDDGYRARLISELARTGVSDEFLAAFHIDIPNHRLMFALDSGDFKKPELKLKSTQNIAGYEIFYPLPVQAEGTEMAGVYRGDFAFPIKIKLQNPLQPTSLEADLIFEDCDFEFSCSSKTLSATLQIEPDLAGDSVSSSMAQFIRQSFYNLPKEKNKYLSLQNISYDKDAHEVYLDFTYHAKIKNFALMLENNISSTFGTPMVMMTKDHIYAKVDVLSGFENFEKTPFLVNVRLNDYVFLRKTIDLSSFKAEDTSTGFFSIFVFAFFVGLLFCLTPFGFLNAATPFIVQNRSLKSARITLFSKVSTLIILILLLILVQKEYPDLFYVRLKSSLFYLGFVLSLLFVQIFKTEFEAPLNSLKNILSGIFQGLWCAAFLALLVTPYQEALMLDFQEFNPTGKAVCAAGLLLGLTIFDFIRLYLYKRTINSKVIELIRLFGKMMLCFAFFIVIFYILSLLNFMASLKAFATSFVFFLVIKYLLNFRAALYWADLSQKQIKSASVVVFIFMFFWILLYAKLLKSFEVPMAEKVLDIEEVNLKVRKGENVLLIIDDKACLECVYNNLTALSSINLKRLKLVTIRADAQPMSLKKLSYFKQLKRIEAPLYVFYNPLVPNGVVLPDILSETTIKDTIKTFAF